MCSVCGVGASASALPARTRSTAKVASVRWSQYVTRKPCTSAVRALSSAPVARFGASGRMSCGANAAAASASAARIAFRPVASGKDATTGSVSPPGSATCRRRCPHPSAKEKSTHTHTHTSGFRDGWSGRRLGSHNAVRQHRARGVGAPRSCLRSAARGPARGEVVVIGGDGADRSVRTGHHMDVRRRSGSARRRHGERSEKGGSEHSSWNLLAITAVRGLS